MPVDYEYDNDGNVKNIWLGQPNSEPQQQFLESTAKYTCFGGARGGGKTWVARSKAKEGVLKYPGIKILFVRREYNDLNDSVINPILASLPPEIYSYNKTEHILTLLNGSTIKFGNMPGYGEAVGGKYQGQEYDWLFIEEATQFLESEFRGLAATVRGVNKIPKRIYMTCNPGGVGHFWVKRLFIDKQFKKGEHPKDYLFIQATVDDNKDLMEADPDYVHQLDLLPEDIRRAHRYGDWNALSGVYFEEFTDGVHTCDPFPIPRHWKLNRTMDYGLDMHACLWVAIDEYGRSYVYKMFSRAGQVVSEAAKSQLEMTAPYEHIEFTLAPPDLWSRSRDSGKTQAELFAQNGVPLIKADNDRKNGWAALKDMFKVKEWPDGKKQPTLVIFNTCENLIDCLKCLMHDNTDPNDVSKNPHDITHSPDALRYYAKSHIVVPDPIKEYEFVDDMAHEQDYMEALFGTGQVSASYMF